MWSQVLQTSPWRTSEEAGEAGQITHLLVLGCTGSPRIHWRSQGTKITARRGWQYDCSYPSSLLNHTAWCWKQEVTLAALHPKRLRRSLLAGSEGLKAKVPLWWTADRSRIWSYTSLLTGCASVLMKVEVSLLLLENQMSKKLEAKCHEW